MALVTALQSLLFFLLRIERGARRLFPGTGNPPTFSRGGHAGATLFR
ncbi:MAG: hypothetical protein RBR16_06580 [Syntrophus sp. (in: bacteria)]|nr:hypothetical protein [Syntrophus sp. (in: bacteria)]